MDRASNLLIAIATYNEIQNLPDLVAQLNRLVPYADILVIDDNSPDGTGRWCMSNESSITGLHCLLRREKSGLGSATLSGFQWALERRYDYVATMDADFSHEPDDLLRLIEELDSNRALDVVIGSRYVPGGSVEMWPWYRRVMSRVVNAYSRLLLRLRTRDNSGAFRVYRTSALGRIDLNRMQCQGHAYLEEILWRMQRAGLNAAEIPIAFRNRKQGTSKTGLKVTLAAAWDIFRLVINKQADQGPIQVSHFERSEGSRESV